jgi:galactokinase
MKPFARAQGLFRSAFGVEPVAVASAPGRINLIGEHVDYHGGHVLPVATAERTTVAVGPLASGFRAVSEHGAALAAAWPVARTGAWSDYVAGVASFLSAGAAPQTGVAVAVASDVPLGAGVSSSAALEVASAAALASWWNLKLGLRDLVAAAHRAETEFVGVPCGMMDQMASALALEGWALLIDCATLETRPVPAPLDLVLVNSGESHALRSSAYAERRREGDAALERLRTALPGLRHLIDLPPDRLEALVGALPSPLDRRVRHVVEENMRAVVGASALEAGDLKTFGRLVNASHDSLRDLYECSTPRLDAIVAAARKTAGVLGARLVGAGWGGSVLVAVESGKGAEVAEALRRALRVAPAAIRLERAGHGVAVGE